MFNILTTCVSQHKFQLYTKYYVKNLSIQSVSFAGIILLKVFNFKFTGNFLVLVSFCPVFSLCWLVLQCCLHMCERDF